MLALLTMSLLSSTPCPPGQLVEGGAHVRLSTQRGPVHLWCRGEPKRVVVYVHGYRDDLDSAFINHQLAAQFAKSEVEAMFIVVAAPSGPGQPVVFEDLDALLEEVGVSAQVPVLVVGHSGGHRTLKAWLGSARVEEVVLLDGFYGESKTWTKWLTARPNAKLRAVGQHTFDHAEEWRLGLPLEVREQVKHERAGCPHMEIVTNGEWIPRVIRESSLAVAAFRAEG